ncbi:MAG: hypothetical protein J4415_00450 [Candidatus Diapherotrites archaeon]|uniref:Uncharacterized protein n=1 Tax=Candidatus Iainarchaeum sp. TaxID=3101447 RepID=A0A8T4KVD3_9ARCH|nr:hypothetical protein [Candidatus Diapherotrites archaeon]
MLEKKHKGFLGPIGDDLPSLVPLIFALIIFFSTFTYAMNSMDSRNEDFDADLATLSISRIMRSNGYITGYEDFRRLCGNINVAGLNYEVALVETELTYDESNYSSYADPEYSGVDILDLRVFDSTPENEDDPDASEFSCSNLSELPELIEIEQRLSSRVFPIVLEDAKIAKPMFLVVITWRP